MNAFRRVSVVALALAALAASPSLLDAQAPAPTTLPTGRVVGRIVDAKTGAGLTDVGVQVVGTTIGGLSTVDGRYVLPRVPAGTVTIHVRRIGFQAKTVTGLVLPAGGAIEQDISLDPSTVQLQAAVVTASAERGTVNEALDQQRTSAGIVNGVTRDQIAKSPDSDAAQAVQRVSGVTVQDGKFVFVRGLGERYTTTSLNGARLPSPEPERKVVPLDLFPAGLLQSVTTSKTFTADQPGDFSGASVDIRTREFPANRIVTYSASAGYNALATGKTVLAAPSIGTEWATFGGRERALPGTVERAGNFQRNFTPAEINGIVRSFRNAWSAEAQRGRPNTSLGMTMGGEQAFAGRRFGYVASGSYNNAQEIRAEDQRAFAEPLGPGSVRTIQDFRGETGRSSVLWGGLLNLSSVFGPRTRVTLNNTFNRTSDNEARRDEGFNENLDLTLQRTTLRFVERSVRSNQLRVQHSLSGDRELDWSLTSSGVTRREPDRSDLVYFRDSQDRLALLSGSDAARRTFADLKEYNGGAAVNYAFGVGEARHRVKVGAMARGTVRDADNRSFSLVPALSDDERLLQPEEIFDGRFASGGTSTIFSVQPLGAGGSYSAADYIGAGYAMVEYALTPRIQLIAGSRLEVSQIEVTTQPTLGPPIPASLQNTDVLPSLVLNVRPSDRQNIRLSATQTLARPEYRELSPIVFRDVLGEQSLFGNPALRRTLIRNADVRWEMYPSEGEVLSFGVFAKWFVDPIERIEVATSGTSQITFVNADGATNYGAEIELRKGLGMLASALNPFMAFANATVMRSDIRTGNATLSASTNDQRPMFGQAPYVVNGGLTFAPGTGRASATVLYNVVGRRITAAGANPLPDAYEQPRQVLDFAMRFPLGKSLSAKLDAKNLLDAPYEITQGPVLRERYLSGRVFTFGLSWQQ